MCQHGHSRLARTAEARDPSRSHHRFVTNNRTPARDRPDEWATQNCERLGALRLTSPPKRKRRRLVLEMLADAGEHGRASPAFVARFTPELFDLVRGGLATAEREIMIVRGRPFEVACVRITDEGWRAIEEIEEHRQP